MINFLKTPLGIITTLVIIGIIAYFIAKSQWFKNLFSSNTIIPSNVNSERPRLQGRLLTGRYIVPDTRGNNGADRIWYNEIPPTLRYTNNVDSYNTERVADTRGNNGAGLSTFQSQGAI